MRSIILSALLACMPAALAFAEAPFSKTEELIETDYAEVARTINTTMRQYHYNPAELESAAYRRIEAETLALGEAATTDEAFLKGFRDIWRDAPFSHVRLDKAQQSADALAAFLDNMEVGGNGAQLAWQGDVAILTVNTMMGTDTIAQITAAYEEIADKSASKLIIDLRNNGGGAFAVRPLVGHVVAAPYDAGGFVSQPWNAANDGPPTPAQIAAVTPWEGWSVRAFWEEAQTAPITKVTFSPIEPVYAGPVRVLTSKRTASAAELAVDALSGSGRAVVIGERTAGQMLSQKLYDLPGGFHLSLPIADYYSMTNGRIEGIGLAPDIVEEADKALEAALAQ